MKPLMKKSLLAVSIALAITGCQNLEQEKSTSNDKVDADEVLVELQDIQTQESPIISQRKERRIYSENKMVTTGSRIRGADLMAVAPMPHISYEAPEYAGENYNHFEDNGVFAVKENSVSTFSIDVDTASYSNVRRMINNGYLPPKDAVRLEEFVNYFDYQFENSVDAGQPFAITTSTAKAPWNKSAHLVQIGIKGFEEQAKELPASNLVFLVDVSGSMQSPNKLGLLKKSLKLLTKQLTKKDKVSMVVYAGASGVVLEPTSGGQKITIEQAIDKLQAGGSTNGAAGIELAYQMAQKGFIKDGINRVILATDGDFNVGMTNHEQLMDLIESKRKTNVFFSSLGFGAGNYNDHLMEQLANKGNGNAAYIDSLKEAKKVLVDERGATLMTIAKDVKIQVEFNPQQVSEYRLLGYENRLLNREDFNNDKVDAGEIGAGHTITALYEVVLKGNKNTRIEPLRYGDNSTDNRLSSLAAEAAMVKLRYKLPDSDKSKLIEKPVLASSFKKNQVDKNIAFASSVAAFAQLLRGGEFLEDWNWDKSIELAQANKGDDKNGYRSEMIQLMQMAKLLADTNTDADTNESDENKVGMLERI